MPACFILYSFEYGWIPRWCSVIIAKKHRNVICIRSYYRNVFCSFKRKYSVIFKKNNAFLRHLKICFHMLLTFYDIKRNVVVLTVIIKHSQSIPCFKQLFHRFCYGFLAHKSSCYGGYQISIFSSAVHYTAIVYSKRSTLSCIFCNSVMCMKITNSSAIWYNISVKPPLITENILKQCFTAAARLTV